MNLIKMDNPQCLIYSIAMVLDQTPEEVIEGLGHNGLEVMWPRLPLPYALRGIHIQEMVDYALKCGFAVIEVEAIPCNNPLGNTDDQEMEVFEDPISRLEDHLIGKKAVLTSLKHACAWDGEKVYDPNGRIYTLENFELVVVYVFIPIVL